MDWLLSVGTFDCERQDCPRGPRPCAFCGMPEADAWTRNMLELYQRCRERKALPFGGGVLDQPEDVMRMFDVIDERVAEHRRKKREESERSAALADARGRP